MVEIERGPGWWQATDGRWYPPRWEYKWVDGWIHPKRGHEPLEPKVAELGLQGWEAMSMVARDPSSSSAVYAVVLMKRPVIE